MKMFLYEELGVKKTTSSWQKVHPKQKNLPENKALLRGGGTLGVVGWPAMIYILQPSALPSSPQKKCLAPHRKRTCPEKKKTSTSSTMLDRSLASAMGSWYKQSNFFCCSGLSGGCSVVQVSWGIGAHPTKKTPQENCRPEKKRGEFSPWSL